MASILFFEIALYIGSECAMIIPDQHREKHHGVETNVGLNAHSLWRPKMSMRSREWQKMLQEKRRRLQERASSNGSSGKKSSPPSVEENFGLIIDKDSPCENA